MEEEERTILAAQRLGVVSMTAGLGGRRRRRRHRSHFVYQCGLLQLMWRTSKPLCIGPNDKETLTDERAVMMMPAPARRILHQSQQQQQQQQQQCCPAERLCGCCCGCRSAHFLAFLLSPNSTAMISTIGCGVCELYRFWDSFAGHHQNEQSIGRYTILRPTDDDESSLEGITITRTWPPR
jgi:hypothetical protein